MMTKVCYCKNLWIHSFRTSLTIKLCLSSRKSLISPSIFVFWFYHIFCVMYRNLVDIFSWYFNCASSKYPRYLFFRIAAPCSKKKQKPFLSSNLSTYSQLSRLWNFSGCTFLIVVWKVFLVSLYSFCNHHTVEHLAHNKLLCWSELINCLIYICFLFHSFWTEANLRLRCCS